MYERILKVFKGMRNMTTEMVVTLTEGQARALELLESAVRALRQDNNQWAVWDVTDAQKLLQEWQDVLDGDAA